MKVAFTYNLRLTDVRETEKEAEYDSAETVSAIAAADHVGPTCQPMSASVDGLPYPVPARLASLRG